MISKQAKKEYDRVYNILNKEKRLKYSLENAEKIKQRTRDFNKKNPNHGKEYRIKNKDRRREFQRAYRLKDPKATVEKRRKYNLKYKNKIKEYNRSNRLKINAYHVERRKKDIEYKIICILRGRIKSAIAKGYKKGSSLELLGCTIDFFKKYISSKFQVGMSWDNYGVYGWHVDHIIPCSSFNLLDESQQKKCFHYTNLQPLWAADNLRKSNKIL